MAKMAYKSKGMKLPKHDMGAPKLDPSSAPKTSPSMQHKEPSHPVVPGDQSMSPSEKKRALPTQDAPPGVAGVNGGTSMALPKGGGVGESDV